MTNADLAQDLVFEENYLGKTDATFTLNFSTGTSMVLAQCYNFVPYGRAGYAYVMKNMQQNANVLAEKLSDGAGSHRRQWPWVLEVHQVDRLSVVVGGDAGQGLVRRPAKEVVAEPALLTRWVPPAIDHRVSRRC